MEKTVVSYLKGVYVVSFNSASSYTPTPKYLPDEWIPV